MEGLKKVEIEETGKEGEDDGDGDGGGGGRECGINLMKL